MVQVAVIIVTWNVRELALDAVRTLYVDLAQSGLSHRVLVVDSASSDGTVDALRAAFPTLECLASDTNLGFAGGNNAGLRLLGFGADTPPDQLPEAVYLLNPDTRTHLGATRALYDALMSRPDVGVVGARLSFGDGSFQHSAFAFAGLRQLWAEFFPLHWRLREGAFNGRYARARYEGKEPFEVGHTLGATMMLKREVILQTGMFDEQFFMYCEEVDWSWRIHKAGWRILCVPQAHVTHLGGQSSGQVRPRSVINLWDSRLRLYRKHYPAWKLAAARWLVRVGMRCQLRRTDDPELRAAYQTVYDMASQA